MVRLGGQLDNWSLAIKRLWQAYRAQIRWLSAAFVFAVVFGLMGLAVYRDRGLLLTFHWRLNLGYLMLTTLLYSSTIGLLFFAWQSILMRISGFSDLRANFRIYYLASLSRRLPTALWYIAGRLYMYKQEGVAETAVIASSTVESIATVLAGVIAYLVLLPSYSFTTLNNPVIPIAGTGLALALVISQPRRVIALLNKVFAIFKREPIALEVKRRDLALWLVIYLAAWLIGGAGLFCLINTIYILPLSVLPEIVGIATITTLISLLAIVIPGGSSLKELAISALLSYYMPFSVGTVVAITYRIWLTLVDVAWAIVAYKYGLRKLAQK